MNDDKMFELMTKMYVKMESTETKIGNIETKIGSMETKIGNLETDMTTVKSSLARIEVEHGNKLDALFDGYKANAEAIEANRVAITKLTDKVHNHEVRLQIVE